MTKYTRKNKAHPTNNRFVNQNSQPIDLRNGSQYERELSGNPPPNEELPRDAYGNVIEGYEGYSDGYNIPDCPTCNSNSDENPLCSGENKGYHKFKPEYLWNGIDPFAKQGCPSPYSRLAMQGGIKGAIKNREETLLRTVGKLVKLLRVNYTGPKCLCYDQNRGQARDRCPICFGIGFVPGYIPYENSKEIGGRIWVRFDPYTENNPLTDSGIKQEVEINAWTLSFPTIRKRDVLICYDPVTGLEEYRYEVMNVLINEISLGDTGAQRINIKRIDPTDMIYRYDINNIPDIKDIQIDISNEFVDGYGILNQLELSLAQKNQLYSGLSFPPDDGQFQNAYIEDVFYDGFRSQSFETGYKASYETNFNRALNFIDPLEIPDYDMDSIIYFEDNLGPIFISSNGLIIKFSVPQQMIDNVNINPLEVIASEGKRYFIDGWLEGYKSAYQDAELYMREKGWVI